MRASTLLLLLIFLQKYCSIRHWLVNLWLLIHCRAITAYFCEDRPITFLLWAANTQYYYDLYWFYEIPAPAVVPGIRQVSTHSHLQKTMSQLQWILLVTYEEMSGIIIAIKINWPYMHRQHYNWKMSNGSEYSPTQRDEIVKLPNMINNKVEPIHL